jgi:hypothetical protein
MRLKKKGVSRKYACKECKLKYSTHKLLVEGEIMQFHCASNLGVERVNENYKRA